MPLRSLKLPLALLTLALATGAPASEYRESEQFADAVSATQAYVERYGADATLLVVDIDNTLLTMQGDLGSDQWFEWQEHLLEHEPASPHLVADDFVGLLQAQGLLFRLGKMRPTQEDLPDLVRQVQGLGVPTLVLTSRGPGFRPATERELTSAGYDFTASCLSMHDVPEGEFMPYNPSRPGEVGLSKEEARLFALGEPREASLAQGVFMTSGQHKGAMLLTALHRAERMPKAVVFVDDHGRHVHRVYDALLRRGIEATVLHYHREDDRVARFRYGDKGEVTRRWRRLEAALDEVFDLPPETPAPQESREHASALAPSEAGAAH